MFKWRHYFICCIFRKRKSYVYHSEDEEEEDEEEYAPAKKRFGTSRLYWPYKPFVSINLGDLSLRDDVDLKIHLNAKAKQTMCRILFESGFLESACKL